jgi:hypothetical protein
MSEILEVVLSLSALVFVFSSMLAIGLSLTIAQIIGPLHNARLVVLALVADFGLMPSPAYLTVEAPIFPEARKHRSIRRTYEDFPRLARCGYVRASGKIVRVFE